MCYVGVFGLFKVIYEGIGYKCEFNYVFYLKEIFLDVICVMCIF